jgi:ssDNA-binding Zn-finger/Zn-ribbon topoisomerase 1
MKRRKLTRAQKIEIVDAQDGICPDCGNPLSVGNIHFDHRRERRMAPDEETARELEQLDNFAAICADPCHKAKTKAFDRIHAKAKRQGGESGQYAKREKAKAEGKHRAIRSRGFQTNRDGRFKAKIGGGISVRTEGL